MQRTRKCIAKCSIAYELCICVARRSRRYLVRTAVPCTACRRHLVQTVWPAILSKSKRNSNNQHPPSFFSPLLLSPPRQPLSQRAGYHQHNPHSENHTTRPNAVAPWPAYNRMMAHQAMRVIGATFGGGSARNAIGRVPREPHTHLPLLGLGALSHPTVRCMTTPAATGQAVIVDMSVNLEWVSGQPDGRPAGGAERPAQARELPLGWLTALRLVR